MNIIFVLNCVVLMFELDRLVVGVFATRHDNTNELCPCFEIVQLKRTKRKNLVAVQVNLNLQEASTS